LITGGNLLPQKTEVELLELTDENPGLPGYSSLSQSAWTKLAAHTSTERSLTATVPANWSDGIYALRLKNESQQASEPVLVNTPDPWFVQGDMGDTATPGGYFIVAGTALERSGGLAPQAALVAKSGGTLIAELQLEERITNSTGYGLRFTVPSSVPEGEYQLWLHNGRGGKAGWVRFSTFIETTLDTVVVKKAKIWPTTVFNVSSYSGSDDDKFSAAIAAANANGGGKIYVPAGTYTLTQQLALPAYTVLAGAGRDSSLIQWDTALTTPLVVGKTLVKGSVTRATFALEDIRLTANATTFISYVVDRSFTKERGWLKRVGIFAPVTEETVWDKSSSAIFLRQTANTLLEDVLTDSAKGLYARDDVSYLKLSGCTFRWNLMNIWLSSQSHNFVLEGNRFEKRGPHARQASFVISAFYGAKPYARDFLWANNLVTQVSTDSTPMSSGYTMDGGDGIYLGSISSTSGTVMNLASDTKSTSISGAALKYAGLGYIAQIIDGKGAGQWRYVTQATPGGRSITVDRAWGIEPDATSTLTVVNHQGRVLMIDNDYERDTQHDDYYLSVDSVKAGNKFGVQGLAMAAASWAGSHYQGTFPNWHLQYLGNRVVRGIQTLFVANLYNEPETGYKKDVAAAIVYRNNLNETAGTFSLRLTSDEGGAVDMLLENNQATNIVLSRWDARKKRNETTLYSGILLRNNKTASGTTSAVQTIAGMPDGVTILP
jgi:hypothetical protein